MKYIVGGNVNSYLVITVHAHLLNVTKFQPLK